MKFTIYQESRKGGRKSNQDRLAYCYSRDALLMVVADGMGGHLHGEVAAQMAVQYITETFQREASPKVADPYMFLSRALTNAHHALLDYATDHFIDDAPRTTCVACLVQEGNAYWAHAGDSRLYHLRNGKVLSRTRDHSRVQLMVEQGLIDEAQALTHPARNRIYSCLGGVHAPQIDFSQRTSMKSGDVLALCSDGIWTPLGGEAMATSLFDANLMEVVPLLLNQAERLAGPNSDNLSIMAMSWDDEGGRSSVGAISTQTMTADQFNTEISGFVRSRAGQPTTGDLSDDEIERAIAEIRSAIRKYSK